MWNSLSGPSSAMAQLAPAKMDWRSRAERARTIGGQEVECVLVSRPGGSPVVLLLFQRPQLTPDPYHGGVELKGGIEGIECSSTVAQTNGRLSLQLEQLRLPRSQGLCLANGIERAGSIADAQANPSLGSQNVGIALHPVRQLVCQRRGFGRSTQ